MKRVDKKGLSPVIATVLLIAMVVVIGMIVFLWIRGMAPELVEKMGKNIELTCNDVDFEASFDDETNTIYISNIGNVPIEDIKAEIHDSSGGFSTDELGAQLGVGESGEFEVGADTSAGDTIVLIPVLLGESEGATVEFTCEKNKHEI